MSRRACVVALVGALVAACGSSAPNIGARFAGPTDVVPFRGITVNSTDVRDYLAVASGRGNELQLVDLTSDRPVLGPTVVFPLSIPSAPRPVRLASASLGDGGADLLVASSAGSAAIELVLTWTDKNTITDVYDLAQTPGAGSAPEILAVKAAPIPGVHGQARVIAALTGGKIAVITAVRGTDGSIALARPAVIRDVGFDAVDLYVHASSAAGTEGLWLFAATADNLATTSGTELFGAAEMRIEGAPETWTPVALDARAPTRLVAAAEVAERITTAERPDTFAPESPLRVYAALDPSGCGREHAMNCGLVTLDPVTHVLAPDPAGELDHRAPMPIAGVPLGIAIAKQPANLTNDVCNDNWSTATPDAAPLYPNARLRIAPGTGTRCTSAVAAVTSSNGSVYIFDLGRWGAPNDTSLLRATSRVSATAVTQVRPVIANAATDVAPLLALWSGDAADSVLSLNNDLQHWFTVWPGYTPTEQFYVGWKIAFPELASRGGVIGRADNGGVYLAAQAQTGTNASGQPIWALGPQLGNPEIGIHPGDIVQLVTTASAACAVAENGDIPETTVAAVLPPDPVRYPGGAVVLNPAVDSAGQPVTGCWDTAVAAAGTTPTPIVFTIRASGHLIYGQSLGYLGRPEKDQRFTLKWQNEADPALTPEQRAIARKLRRFYYPGAEKCDATSVCTYFGDIDPMAPGPTLSFRLGWLATGGRVGPEPLRGEQLLIQTQSGIAPMARKPAGSGALPLGIGVVDRSAIIAPGDVVRFYVAFQDDQVFVFGPGESQAQAFSIR